jgi:F420H(2)-dependent quinone reductase
MRRNAVIYFHDRGRVIIFASQAGRPENPSWYYNAPENPEVELGRDRFRAELIADESERTRLFELAERVLPAFASYRESRPGGPEHGAGGRAPSAGPVP